MSIDHWEEENDMCCSLIVENEQSEDYLHSYLLERWTRTEDRVDYGINAHNDGIAY